MRRAEIIERLEKAEGEWALRRIRVRYLPWHNPRVWAAYIDQPGRETCYCHGSSLDAVWLELHDYFAGKGYCRPQAWRRVVRDGVPKFEFRALEAKETGNG